MVSILDIIKKHRYFFILQIVAFLLAISMLIYKPVGPHTTLLTETYPLFSLANISAIALFFIGGHFIVMWYRRYRENMSFLLWGIAFIVYSFLFIGLCLYAMGYDWADMSSPKVFFLFRQTMIIFLTLIYFGTVIRLTEDKFSRYVLSLLILTGGYTIFIYGLPILGDIEWTMYAFVYLFLIPVSLFISYIFYLYYKFSSLNASLLISIAWIYYAISYAFWSPLHYPETMHLWYVSFSHFTLSIMLMLLGYMLLPYELRIKTLEERIEMLHD